VQIPSAPQASAVTSPAPATASRSPQAPLRLDCSELGPDVALIPSHSGSLARSLIPAGLAQLPRGWVAYHDDGQVRLVSTDGERRLRLAPGIGPRWLPNGRELAFVSAPEGLPRIYVAALDCSSVRAVSGPLTPHFDASAKSYADLAVKFSVSPSGTLVAYARREADDGAALYVAEVDTGVERKLVDRINMVEPAWSPGSQSLIVSTEGAQSSIILSVALATGQTRELGSAYQPSFAFLSDGRLLLRSARGDAMATEERESYLLVLDPEQASRPFELPGSRLAPGFYTAFLPTPNGKTVAAAWSLSTGNGPAAIRDHGLAVFTVPLHPPLHPVRAASKAQTKAEIVFVRPLARKVTLSKAVPVEPNQADDPSWASDSRHLTFSLTSCDPESLECLNRIVAVDAPVPRAKLAFLAYGKAPQWQPAEPSRTPAAQ
jgi:dipeptidyl aminopeptidase/acylaminoacyl peptidase